MNEETAEAVLWAAKRHPQHPRRVATALHVLYPDDPMHASYRYQCSLCPPCDHRYERDWFDTDIDHASCASCNKPLFRLFLNPKTLEYDMPNPEWDLAFPEGGLRESD